MPEQKSTFPTEIIELPSKGWLYSSDSKLASGEIELKYPTAKEEDILTSQNLIKKGIVIDEFIKSLIIDKDIDINKILIGDKGAIMVAARRLAYGNDYPVKLSCNSCDKSFETVIDLKKFKYKEISKDNYDEENKNEFTYTLPISKVEITGRFLTHSDQTKIKKELKQLAKVDGKDHEITVRISHVITSVNGDDKIKTIKDFVNNKLLAQDSLKLRSYLTKVTPNIKTTHEYTCPRCGEEMEGEVPLGTDFFWPTK